MDSNGATSGITGSLGGVEMKTDFFKHPLVFNGFTALKILKAAINQYNLFQGVPAHASKKFRCSIFLFLVRQPTGNEESTSV